MKLQYLGTGAAERVPATFCHCPICEHARLVKGKEIRTQTQALIDDGKILVDFGGDTYLHSQQYTNLDLSKITNLLITHWHSDHLYPEELSFRHEWFSPKLDSRMNIYVNPYTSTFLDPDITGDSERFKIHIYQNYEPFSVTGYTVWPLPAQHGNFEGDCSIFVIRDPDGHTLLWTHDTAMPTEEMMNYLNSQHFHFDFVSLDCCNQNLHTVHSTHMGWEENLALIEQLTTDGSIDSHTQIATSHFSHNAGLNHQQMSALSSSAGILTAYDGMTVTF